MPLAAQVWIAIETMRRIAADLNALSDRLNALVAEMEPRERSGAWAC